MKFEVSNDCNGIVRFCGELSATDIVRLELDAFDRALLFDRTGKGPPSAADQLLVLEMIFRRYAEQTR